MFLSTGSHSQTIALVGIKIFLTRQALLADTIFCQITELFFFGVSGITYCYLTNVSNTYQHIAIRPNLFGGVKYLCQPLQSLLASLIIF